MRLQQILMEMGYLYTPLKDTKSISECDAYKWNYDVGSLIIEECVNSILPCGQKQ